jgi:hypothetical protein
LRAAPELTSEKSGWAMVGAAGIEPATLGLEIRCSIRLSYAPIFKPRGMNNLQAAPK